MLGYFQITRKSDKLMSVEKQSRQVLDELDYLNEWFADAHERLIQVFFHCNSFRLFLLLQPSCIHCLFFSDFFPS